MIPVSTDSCGERLLVFVRHAAFVAAPDKRFAGRKQHLEPTLGNQAKPVPGVALGVAISGLITFRPWIV